MVRSLSNSEFRKGLAQHTKSSALKQALNALEPYFQKFGNDLQNDQNFMVRFTSAGPQLVLIDGLPAGTQRDAEWVAASNQ